MIYKHILLIRKLNDQTVRYLTIQLSISQKLNGFKYCYVSLTIRLKHQTFVYTQLNDQTVLF